MHAGESTVATSDGSRRPTANGAYRGFEGVVGRTFGASTPAWPGRPTAGRDAPNVVVVLIDDMGFGASSAFGGPCALVRDAIEAWAERNVSTPFLIACVSTALLWTCSLAVAMLELVALATGQ